jgi:hypothetical protein
MKREWRERDRVRERERERVRKLQCHMTDRRTVVERMELILLFLYIWSFSR